MRAPSTILTLVLALAVLVACGSNGASVAAPDAEAQTATSACASCHLPEYESAAHHVGERPTACAVCHSQDSWRPPRLDHAWWPLTGAHATAKCFACHTGDPPVFKGTARECIGCHRPEYEKAPDHVLHGFPTTCAECHSTTAWKPQLPEAHPPTPPMPPLTPATTASAPPEPRASSTPRPKPRPKPAPTPTATATTPPPDNVTGASRRR